MESSTGKLWASSLEIEDGAVDAVRAHLKPAKLGHVVPALDRST